MKKFSLVLLACISLQGLAAQASPAPDRSLTMAFDWPWASNLQGQINHLNRMVGHVRWQFTRYHSDKALQRDYWAIRHEVERLNAEFKQPNYNRGHVRAEIERLHGRLHDLELRLKVKKVDYYRWK